MTTRATLLLSYLCIFLSSPLRSTVQAQLPQQADTLKVRSLNDSLQGTHIDRYNTFKLIPKYHPGKDSGGFQLIPTNPGNRSVQLEGDIILSPSPPEIWRTVDPVYPDSAKRAGLEGSVTVSIHIDKEGKVVEVKVVQSDARIFDRPAMDAAEQFVFKPGHDLNGPVEAWMNYRFEFRLPGKK